VDAAGIRDQLAYRAAVAQHGETESAESSEQYLKRKERDPMHCSWVEMSPWLQNVHVSNVQELNLSAVYYKSMFETYLENCAYSLEQMDAEADAHKPPAAKPPDFHRIPELSTEELDVIQRKICGGRASEQEKWIYEKHRFRLKTDTGPDTEKRLWEQYWCDAGKKRKLLQTFYEHNYGPEELKRKEKRKAQFAEVSSGVSRKRSAVEQLCAYLKLDHSQDSSKTVSHRRIRRRTDEILRLEPSIQKDFGFRVRHTNKSSARAPPLKRAVSLVNKVFLEWGGSKLVACNAKRARVDGRRIVVSDFKIVAAKKHILLWPHLRKK